MGSDGFRFVEFPWREGEPDACRERLCSEPTNDPIYVECAIEGASFVQGDAPTSDEIVVMAYNVERGLNTEAQIDALGGDLSIPSPDVILMSEADRGCERTGCRNTAREWARALSMNYVYGVEFVELPRWWSPGGGGPLRRRCEHGNAILSRYPLGNVRLIRYAVNRSWHSWWQRLLRVGQPRLGGRMAMSADVKVGKRYLRVYSVHFESKGSQVYRPAQAAELARDGLSSPHGAVIGGDMNCVEYKTDLADGSATDGVTQALLARGYADAHAAVPASERSTTRSGYPIDLIFGREAGFSDAGIGSETVWGELSDHLPVWAHVRLG
jgi:endonuclease/exonuclease/phosphatase family metal-dependent hydrolase